MLNTASAAATMQNSFKKVFENAEKEVDVAVNHFVRATGCDVNNVEVEELRKRVGESLNNIKKLVLKFNASALFFIGLNVDPLNPKLHNLITGSRLERKKGSGNQKDVVQPAETKKGVPEGKCQEKPMKDSVKDSACVQKPVKKRSCISEDKAVVSLN